MLRKLKLKQAKYNNVLRIARGFVTDFGSLGILYLEGKHRNPGIDDLQMVLYAQAKISDALLIAKEYAPSKKEACCKHGIVLHLNNSNG